MDNMQALVEEFNRQLCLKTSEHRWTLEVVNSNLLDVAR